MGVTVARAALQQVDGVVLHDRKLHPAEELLDVEPAVDRRRRTALTSKIATRKLVVDLEVEAAH